MWDSPDVAEIDLMTKGATDEGQVETTFAPKINKRSEQMVRDRKVQDLLYEDAIKRQDAQQTRVQQAALESKSQMHHGTSHTNIEYLVHKFNREFEPIYESIANVEQPEGEQDYEDDTKLNYRQLSELLYSMGYLSGSQASESEERILLSTMWSSLGGEENDGLNKEVVRAFLIAVEGVKITDGVQTKGPEEFGETKDGDFYPDCAKITKYFKLFYLNRIRYIGL